MTKINKTLKAKLQIANAIAKIATAKKSAEICNHLKNMQNRLMDKMEYSAFISNKQGGIESTSGFMGLVTLAERIESLVDVCMWAERQSHISVLTPLQAMVEMMEITAGFGAARAAVLLAVISKCTIDDYKYLMIIHDVLSKGVTYDTGREIAGNTRFSVSQLEEAIVCKLKLAGPDALSTVTNMINSFVANGTLVAENNHYIYSKYHAIESIFNKLSNHKCDLPKVHVHDESFTAHQTSVINGLMLDDNKVSVLSGEAGTGKSYTTARVIEAYVLAGYNVLVCSPTHKACKVLTQSLKDINLSVNRLVGSRVCTIDSAYYVDIEDSTADVIIMDEASMAATSHFGIFSRIKCSKIILVGDPAQLPPVGAGGLFASILSNPLSPIKKYNLTQKMRSSDQAVIDLCNSVRESTQMPVTEVIPLLCSRFDREAFRAGDFAHKQAEIQKLSIYIGRNRDAQFIANDNMTVDCLNLCVLMAKEFVANQSEKNKKAYSDAIRVLIKSFASTSGESKYVVPEIDLFCYNGASVVWDGNSIKINENYKIQRGCVGYIKAGKLVIEAQRYSKQQIAPIIEVTVDKELITEASIGDDRLRLNYATTVHKSQGSTYDSIVYVVKETYNGQLSGSERPMAYVAVSRAKHSAKVMSINGKNAVDLYNPKCRDTYYDLLTTISSDF